MSKPFTSNLAEIISTIICVENFNNTDMLAFVEYLLKHLVSQNHKYLIPKFLLSIHNQLDDVTLNNIRNKAESIYNKSQYPTLKPQNKNDYLTSLPDVVIDHIAYYTCKKDSITMSYLNRHLYIESQKLSFIASQRYDYHLTMDDDIFLDFLTQSNCCGNSRLFPVGMEITAGGSFNKQYHPMTTLAKNPLELGYFNNLFYSLDYLDINLSSNFMLPFIPVDLLFDKENINKMTPFVNSNKCKDRNNYNSGNNFNNHNHNDNNNNNLHLTLGLDGNEKTMTNVSKFCHNYKEYFTNKCQCDLDQIRRLDELVIIRSTDHDHYANFFNVNYDGAPCVNLFETLRQNFNKLRIKTFNVNITSWDMLLNIFHLNLCQLSFQDGGYLAFKLNQNALIMLQEMETQRQKEKEKETEKKENSYTKTMTKRKNVSETTLNSKRLECNKFTRLLMEESNFERGQLPDILRFVCIGSICNVLTNIEWLEINDISITERKSGCIKPLFDWLKFNVLEIMPQLKTIKLHPTCCDKTFEYTRTRRSRNTVTGRNVFIKFTILARILEQLGKCKALFQLNGTSKNNYIRSYDFDCNYNGTNRKSSCTRITLEWNWKSKSQLESMMSVTKNSIDTVWTAYDDRLLKLLGDSDKEEDLVTYNENLDCVDVATNGSKLSMANINFNTIQWFQRKNKQWKENENLCSKRLTLRIKLLAI